MEIDYYNELHKIFLNKKIEVFIKEHWEGGRGDLGHVRSALIELLFVDEAWEEFEVYDKEDIAYFRVLLSFIERDCELFKNVLTHLSMQLSWRSESKKSILISDVYPMFIDKNGLSQKYWIKSEVEIRGLTNTESEVLRGYKIRDFKLSGICAKITSEMNKLNYGSSKYEYLLLTLGRAVTERKRMQANIEYLSSNPEHTHAIINSEQQIHKNDSLMIQKKLYNEDEVRGAIEQALKTQEESFESKMSELEAKLNALIGNQAQINKE